MANWLKVNTIFCVLELIQSLLIALWVYKHVWFVAALAAATLLGMLVLHLLTGASVIVTWLLVELRKPLPIVGQQARGGTNK